MSAPVRIIFLMTTSRHDVVDLDYCLIPLAAGKPMRVRDPVAVEKTDGPAT